MDSDMIILEVTEKMDKTIENLEKRFATVRAGRANPSSLDGVTVEYYGGKADQTFSLDVPAKVTFANSNPARDNYKLKITSLDDAVTFLESEPIDSIYDVQITPNDHHLVVLFASTVTRNRIIEERKNYGSAITARDGVSYSGWLDLGSITNKSGIFIGLNLDHNDFNTDISTFNNLSISQIVAKLNTDYPTGL